MEAMRGRIARGTMWLGIARGLTNLIGFASTLVLARLLTPADFGLVALGLALLAIVVAATEMSMAAALVHHADPTEEHFHTAWSLNMARSISIGLLFGLAGYPMAALYGEPHLIGVMWILALGIAIQGFKNPKMAIFARNLIFKQEVVLLVTSKTLGVVAAISLALVYQSYWALLIGPLVTQLSLILISYLYVPFRPRIGFNHARELWSFSGWMTLGQATRTLNWKFDQLLVGGLLGRADLGYYTVADTLASLPTREATAPLAQTLFPAFARVRDDAKRLGRAYTSVQTLVSAIAFPAAFGFALIAEPLVRLTMGEKWLPAVFLIEVLASVFGLQTMASAVEPLAMALGKTRELFKRDLLFFFIRLPAIALAMWFWGLPGLVYARLFTGNLGIYINMWMVRHLIGIPIWRQLASNVRSLLGVAVMVGAVYWLRQNAGVQGTPLELTGILAKLLVTGALTYVVTRWVVWKFVGSPDGEEREIINALRALAVRVSGKGPLANKVEGD